MAYTFKMVIGGVIGLVNRPANGDSEGSVLVVVPDTLLGEEEVGTRSATPDKAVDDEDLLRHDPMLKISPRHTIHLRGQRLEFGLPAGTLEVPKLGDMLKIRDALPGDVECRLARDYLSGSKALAILEITTGTVEAKSEDEHKAYLDRIGEGKAGPLRNAAHHVEWTVEVENDGPLELREIDLEGGKVNRHFFHPRGSMMELELMNHRAHAGRPPDPKALEDFDFRWFYDMLASRDEVRTRLDGGKRGKAPVPRVPRVPTNPAVPSAGHGMMFAFVSTDGQLCRPCEFCD